MTPPQRPDPAFAELPGYDPATVERTWQDRWAAASANRTDIPGGARPYYALMMFPYPSAEGLHVGNLFAFTGNDIFARFQRLRGHDVFEPIGFDAFGIHSENHALKVGIHPTELIPRNIANFTRQLGRAGLMVDWSRVVDTTDPAYYKWTQWVFLQLYKRGLAYRKAAAVNWCPNDKTVLANEQVENGLCERCGAKVEQRFLEQWFFRITDYAGRLLANLDGLDWSQTTKTAQRTWIGRSDGAEIRFRILNPLEDAGSAAVHVTAEVVTGTREVTVFTTRPDTIFGATYLVLAPEHPLVDAIVSAEQAEAVAAYRARTAAQDLVTRKSSREKTGAFTGAYAVNPATGEMIPVWIADYVLMEYGTGAIMAVPGHDERDFEFATVFRLPIERVVAGPGEDARTPLAAAYVDNAAGRLVNSGRFDGYGVDEARTAITAWLEEHHAAKPVVNYRLHDWCISRQRYWGPPIPIVYCDACGPVPVPEQDLPVLLPNIPDFRPDDSGVSPLARHEEWFRVPCPQCGAAARRETDVSDTFLDSGWYFLRYPSVGHDDVPFDAAITGKWLPVDSYIGGNEHAVLHLMYARFLTMVLHDAGHLGFEEPFTKFRAHGLIIRDGAKMSKSKGNVVNPDEYIEKWGADTFRTYLMFLGPFEEGGDFRDAGISGVRRFLDRVWASVHAARTDGAPDPDVIRKLHQTIRKVGEDIPKLQYNTAIAAMMEYMNTLRRGERIPHRAEVEPLLPLVAPFAPHAAEELWATCGHAKSIFDSGWPAFDPALAEGDTMTVAVQVNGKTRGSVTVARSAGEAEIVAMARADGQIGKFVPEQPKKVIYVPGRLLNFVG
ncbi:MAG TPA: leucine--tRNA ligase [Gemmatimonadaceae bacterium]|nr:leucine--tRNA ligase [Gemmatimonadaceae bacterium]